MTELCYGNIFDSKADALVNPVNCVGVMGGGLALEFKKRFPSMYKQYLLDCSKGFVYIGKITIHELHDNINRPQRYILNFPTKADWKYPSKLQFIRSGLIDLHDRLCASTVSSIAVPALGCGFGGLKWDAVRPLIEQAFVDLPKVRVELYSPQD